MADATNSGRERFREMLCTDRCRAKHLTIGSTQPSNCPTGLEKAEAEKVRKRDRGGEQGGATTPYVSPITRNTCTPAPSTDTGLSEPQWNQLLQMTSQQLETIGAGTLMRHLKLKEHVNAPTQ